MKEAIEPIVDLAIRLDYKKGLSKIYTISGVKNCWADENLSASIANLEKAIDVSTQVNDFVSLILSNCQMGITLGLNSEFEKGDSYLQNAIDFNMAANSLWGASIIKAYQSLYIYIFSGQIKRSLKRSTESIKLAEQSGDVYSKAVAYTYYGLSLYYACLFDKCTMTVSK